MLPQNRNEGKPGEGLTFRVTGRQKRRGEAAALLPVRVDAIVSRDSVPAH